MVNYVSPLHNFNKWKKYRNGTRIYQVIEQSYIANNQAANYDDHTRDWRSVNLIPVDDMFSPMEGLGFLAAAEFCMI